MNEKVRKCLKNLYWDICEGRKTKAELRKELDKLVEAEKFYIISRTEYVGLFSYVQTIMRQIGYAVNNGCIPVVDMRGIRNPYVEDGEENEINWWELYFEQPTEHSLEEAYRSSHELCKEENMSTIPHGGSAVFYKKSRWYWSTMYREFFRLNKKANEYFENEYRTLMNSDGSNVLGVLVRGTDRIGAVGHSVMPTVEEILAVVREKMKHYDKIYLATEEYSNVELFEAEFPGKILVNKRMYYDQQDFSSKTINEIRFERENDKYLCGLEYLSSVMLLAKCGGIVGGSCSGTVAAIYINGYQYKDIECFEHDPNR